MLARGANYFLHCPCKQGKTSVNSVLLPCLVIIGTTAKKRNLYFRKLLKKNSLFAACHI